MYSVVKALSVLAKDNMVQASTELGELWLVYEAFFKIQSIDKIKITSRFFYLKNTQNTAFFIVLQHGLLSHLAHWAHGNHFLRVHLTFWVTVSFINKV